MQNQKGRCCSMNHFHAQLPALLATQNTHRIPGHTAVVYRYGQGRFAQVRLIPSRTFAGYPAWGEERISGMIEGAAGLVYFQAKNLGCTDHAVCSS